MTNHMHHAGRDLFQEQQSQRAVERAADVYKGLQDDANLKATLDFVLILIDDGDSSQDGSLLKKDLWIDEKKGVILDAQRTFYVRKERPDTVVDLGGNILSPGLIDIQINGAYDFDFSVYENDDDKYIEGLEMVARRIVETGVTALLPTIITQHPSLYPSLLRLLQSRSPPPNHEYPHGGATLLGWHAEGPFLQRTKRGAHAEAFLVEASEGWASVERVYGDKALADSNDGESKFDGVRMITAAPEVEGVMQAIKVMTERGIVVSIGHSIASSAIASRAVHNGARLITHLFNAMPQLHHRDPGIIGLLGATPGSLVPSAPSSHPQGVSRQNSVRGSTMGARYRAFTEGAATTEPEQEPPATSEVVSEGDVAQIEAYASTGAEALNELDTPPQTPMFGAVRVPRRGASLIGLDGEFKLDDEKIDEAKTAVPVKEYERPFYGLIVDGVHSHPNSVRLAYSAYKEGCILITDAMKVLDPHMRDGVHEWRDGKRVVKDGVRLYIEGTDTLAGSVVTLDTCVRNFARFTGCSLGEAIRCATFNPARCLNIENKRGTLRPGAQADLVVFDQRGHVLSTWVRGRKVWASDRAEGGKKM